MSFEIRNILGSVVERIVESDRRYRERCSIGKMDEHILTDLGISREQLLANQRRGEAARRKFPWSNLSVGRNMP